MSFEGIIKSEAQEGGRGGGGVSDDRRPRHISL